MWDDVLIFIYSCKCGMIYIYLTSFPDTAGGDGNPRGKIYRDCHVACSSSQ